MTFCANIVDGKMLRHVLAGLALFVIVIFAASPRAEEAALQTLASQVTSDLLDRLDEHRGLSGQVKDRLEPKAIAIWPFDETESPLPDGAGEAITRAMEKALREQAGSGLKIITRTDLKALIDEAAGLSSFQSIDRPVALLADKAAVDILAVGRVLPGLDGRLNLTYRLVSMSGEILSLSEAYRVPEDMDALGLRRKMLDMDAAWKQAAQKLSVALPELTSVETGRLADGETRLQGRFGPYFLARVIGGLEQAYINPISGFRVAVVRPGSTEKPGRYRLTGRYWDLGYGLGIRLDLRAADGDGASWSGVIAKASLPDDFLRADTVGPGALDREAIGPMGLMLTTDRGNDPVYRIGESLTLKVSSARAGFLHCYYGQANGEVLKIFPNPYHPTAAIDAGAGLSIPGTDMPFDFVMSPPLGDEWVRCFAAEQDPSLSLPRGLLTNDLGALPPELADRLVESYRSLVGLPVSEAALVLSVAE